MSNDPLRAQASEVDPTAPPAPDERDEKIARLERSLEHERENASTLRSTVDELRFKIDILEKSYAKQLTDAREAREKAEAELAAQRARAAELGTGGEETLKLLEEARATLSTLTAERNELRSRLARSEKTEPGKSTPDPESRPHDQTLTIDDMLTTSRWRIERRAAGEGHLNAQVQEDTDAPAEMISPELVFAKPGKRDEDS